MREEEGELRDELELVDTDLGFLFFIVTAVLLSFRATVRQRDALCLATRGETDQAARVGDVTRIRLAADALIAGSLGFFFMQALDACKAADPEDPLARRLAGLDVIAGFLVLLAGLIRLLEQNMARLTQCSGSGRPPN